MLRDQINGPKVNALESDHTGGEKYKKTALPNTQTSTKSTRCSLSNEFGSPSESRNGSMPNGINDNQKMRSFAGLRYSWPVASIYVASIWPRHHITKVTVRNRQMYLSTPWDRRNASRQAMTQMQPSASCRESDTNGPGVRVPTVLTMATWSAAITPAALTRPLPANRFIMLFTRTRSRRAYMALGWRSARTASNSASHMVCRPSAESPNIRTISSMQSTGQN